MILFHVSRSFYFLDKCFGGFDGLAENLLLKSCNLQIIMFIIFTEKGLAQATLLISASHFKFSLENSL